MPTIFHWFHRFRIKNDDLRLRSHHNLDGKEITPWRELYAEMLMEVGEVLGWQTIAKP